MSSQHFIKFYFKLGLMYDEIIALLAQNHRIVISMRTLKRHLRTLKLFRRKFHSDLWDVVQFIDNEVRHSGNQNGYRWMHLKCKQAGLLVSRHEVATLIQILDPEGVELRRRRRLRRREYYAEGPNFLWHLDSYDKLKPYGICINGCVDGFSRHMIWLEAYHTNSDPRVIAGYYMKAIELRRGCPANMRGDMGTENSHVAQIQSFCTGSPSFIYGRSTANQRIERWWGILRMECVQFWIDLFQLMKDTGHFSGDFVDKNLVQFCFMKLIQVSR